MFEVIERTLWGNVTKEELKEFGLLSSVFFLILAAFQMLRIIKDSTFITLVGPQNLPYAKMVSLVSFFLIVLFFNKMVDWFDHAMLVYVISTFYGVLFLIFAYLLSQSTVGAGQLPILINQGLGWAVYIAAESLGSFVVAVFWSFAEVISHVNTSTAKRGYPLIVLGGELGAFLGAFLLMTQATKIGVPMLAYIAAGTLLVVPLVIKLYTVKYPEKHKVEPKKTTGIIEGIKLICTKRYLMGILVISTAFELISFLYEYQMHSAAHKTFGSIEKITEFLGIYGVAINTVSLLFVLFGTSFVIRRFGVTACLIAYPVGIACLVACSWMLPSIWMFLITVVGIKGLGYALNNPCKEILYITTSYDAKFKAKSWIDVQVARSAEASSATFASLFSSLPLLLICGSIISLGIIAIWIPIAYYVGMTNRKLVAENKIIE